MKGRPMRKPNPFKPTAGAEPPVLVGRSVPSEAMRV